MAFDELCGRLNNPASLDVNGCSEANMTRHGLLIILLVALIVLPIGSALCANEAMPAAPVDNCSHGCDAAADDCCGCELARPPTDQANATLANVEQTIPHVFVLIDALPEPTAVPHAALRLERTVTLHDFLICLTRAERAPPA